MATFDVLMDEIKRRMPEGSNANALRYAARSLGVELKEEDLDVRGHAVTAHHAEMLAGGVDEAFLLLGLIGDDGIGVLSCLAATQWVADLGAGGIHEGQAPLWIAAGA